RDLSALGIDTIDVAAALLLLRATTFELGHDAVAGIGEPDRAIRLHHHVIRRVEPLALVLVGDDRDGPVGFGPRHPAGQMLAGQETPLAIAGVAVAVV